MAMKQCKECGGQVSTKAAKCPGCGAPTGGRSSILKILGTGFLCFIALAMCISAGDKGDGAKADSPEAEEAILEAELRQLLAIYEDNELKGDGAYKDKLVRVTGKVGDVKNDIIGDPFITVGTGRGALEIPVVQCSLSESEKTKAANLTKGQSVTVRGRVSGLMMNVLFDDCVIE